MLRSHSFTCPCGAVLVLNAQEEQQAAPRTSVTPTLLICFALQAAYPLLNTLLFQQMEKAERQVLHLPAQGNLTRFQTSSYSWDLGRGTRPVFEDVLALKISAMIVLVEMCLLVSCHPEKISSWREVHVTKM